jgi:HEAT repeat protein
VAARQVAARALGSVDDARAVAALVEAARDAEPRLQAALIAPLAGRDEPEARQAAVGILTRPGVEDWVIRSTWPSAGETVFQAWEQTRDPRLLVQLAYCGDPRAFALLAAAIVDPELDSAHRDALIRYVRAGEYSLVPALLQAADIPGTLLLPVGQALIRLGAVEEGIAVLAREIREGDLYGQAASELGQRRQPAARTALLDVVRERPTPALAQALGWYGDPEVVEALAAAASGPGLRLACVDALEKAGPAGRDALAALAESDLLAARALARQRDERALAPLLEALASEDPELAFEGADGLRDLRSQAAAPALLGVVETHADDDVVACAAHALVSMQASEADAALELLADRPSPALRRLAEIWR